MIERSNEIIKQLNRITNDRSLKPHVRKQIGEAIRHIKELHDAVGNIRDLYLKLSKNRKNVA